MTDFRAEYFPPQQQLSTMRRESLLYKMPRQISFAGYIIKHGKPPWERKRSKTVNDTYFKNYPGGQNYIFFQLCFDFALGFAKNPTHKGQYELYNCQSVPLRFCFLGRDFSFINFPFSRQQVQNSKLCWITLTFIEREANEQLLSAFRDMVVHRLWSILRTEISQLKGNRFCSFNNAFLCIFSLLLLLMH